MLSTDNETKSNALMKGEAIYEDMPNVGGILWFHISMKQRQFDRKETTTVLLHVLQYHFVCCVKQEALSKAKG